MTQEQPDWPNTEPESEPDPFDNLVLDDDFVRGGSYEPPARTRVAIARFGGRQTSWRHGGGLHDVSRQRQANRPDAEPVRRLPGKPRRRNSPLTSSAESKLPIIVALVVVVIAAVLIFR